ncbi:MAG: hypothetical protein ACOCX3_02580, partial [Chloroflexota bacterium]
MRIELTDQVALVTGSAHRVGRVIALELARAYSEATSFLFLGRGPCFPLALEGALKLKEISYIHA